MKKVSVVYATKTKHSKKIADAVSGALGVSAQNIANHPDIGETGLLFIVGGIYGGESLPELRDFVAGLDARQVKRAALITTSVSNAKGQDSVRSCITDKGIPVEDEFRCFGSLLLIRAGHPNKADIQNAVEFALALSGK
jgi:flavodoxin